MISSVRRLLVPPTTANQGKMMPMLLPLLLRLLGSAPGSAAPQASLHTACAGDDAVLRAGVAESVAAPRMRALWGMGQTDPALLRVLADDRDAALCQRLRTTATATPGGSPSVRWAYYELGGFYFVAVRRLDSPSFGLGSAAVTVYDRNLNALGVWAL